MHQKIKQDARHLEARVTRLETLLGVLPDSNPHYEITDPDVGAVRAALGVESPVPDRAVHRALTLTGGSVSAAAEMLRLQYGAKAVNGAPSADG